MGGLLMAENASSLVCVEQLSDKYASSTVESLAWYAGSKKNLFLGAKSVFEENENHFRLLDGSTTTVLKSRFRAISLQYRRNMLEEIGDLFLGRRVVDVVMVDNDGKSVSLVMDWDFKTEKAKIIGGKEHLENKVERASSLQEIDSFLAGWLGKKS